MNADVHRKENQLLGKLFAKFLIIYQREKNNEARTPLKLSRLLKAHESSIHNSSRSPQH